MPLMSAMVQPMADLWSLKTHNNLPYCSSFNAAKITIGKVSPVPKYAYLKPFGSGLSSSCGSLHLKALVSSQSLEVPQSEVFMVH